MKSRGGRWFLRIDDLDRGREAPDAATSILEDLEVLGFEWDGAVQYQQPHMAEYRSAAEQLRREGYAFDCACSRRDVARAGIPGIEGPIYPGTCRGGVAPGRAARSIRLRAPTARIVFEDDWQGTVTQDLAREVGDFVIWRADAIAAYHLATVLDDARLGVTRVVRGTDLLASTPRQIALQALLDLPSVSYAHHPLVTHRGQKLGKRLRARRIEVHHPAQTLVTALAFLRQHPPPELGDGDAADVWKWAIANWIPQEFAVSNTT